MKRAMVFATIVRLLSAGISGVATAGSFDRTRDMGR